MSDAEIAIDYSVYYRRWHDESPGHFDKAAAHLAHWLGPSIAHLPADARVLDYGCGFGLLTSFLRGRFPDTAGVDASAQQVAVARGRGLPVTQVTVEDFPAWALERLDHFDAVFLFDVLEHVPPASQMAFLRRLARTLKPGGEIYIKVPNANSLLASRWRYNDWTHGSSFTECSLHFVCHHAGLGELTLLDDDSSGRLRWPWVPRWKRRRHYVKAVVRWLWRQYLRSEMGDEANQLPLGVNLMARAKRVS